MFKADINLVLKQGSDFTFSMSFLDDDDEPLDLTLYPNSSFIAKLCSPDGDIVISANTTNGQLLLSPTATHIDTLLLPQLAKVLQ